jgi:DNA adenine methylase
LLPIREVDDPRKSEFSLLQLGIAGLFFNRTNFSGIIGAGPIGGQKQASAYKIDCHFNRAPLARQVARSPRVRDRNRSQEA